MGSGRLPADLSIRSDHDCKTVESPAHARQFPRRFGALHLHPRRIRCRNKSIAARAGLTATTDTKAISTACILYLLSGEKSLVQPPKWSLVEWPVDLRKQISAISIHTDILSHPRSVPARCGLVPCAEIQFFISKDSQTREQCNDAINVLSCQGRAHHG